MTKKMSKKESERMFIILVVTGIVWLAIMFTEAFNSGESIIILGIMIIAIVTIFKFLSWKKSNRDLIEKRQQLMDKYNDKEIVENIINQTLWHGETSDQIVESLGKAEDIDQKSLRTKTKEIWKYGHEGENNYRLKINLKNDVVIGWNYRQYN